MVKLSNHLSKQDRDEVNKMAAIIRNCRCSNGYISPHVAAQSLYELGYRKQTTLKLSEVLKQ